MRDSRGGKQALLAQVGGFYRRFESPRFGLSTVRRAQTANPSPSAKKSRRDLFSSVFFVLYMSLVRDSRVGGVLREQNGLR